MNNPPEIDSSAVDSFGTRSPGNGSFAASSFGTSSGVNGKATAKSSTLGFLLICLFGLPFAAFGVFALWQAFRLIGAGPGSQSFWYPLMFGVIFSSIGFGLIVLALTGSKRFARQRRLEVEHPTEPWLWRADWAQGRVYSKTRTNMISGWVFAIFWNLVSLPIAWFVVPSTVRQKGSIAYVVLLFPAVGVYLLFHAIYESLVLHEFGNTCFEMASVPGVIGRDLKGSIQARFPHAPDHGVHLRISCAHRVTTGSGNTQTTQESIMWRDETDLEGGQLCPGPTGTLIPIDFHIPLDAHPTEKISVRDEYVWYLEALANVPGVKYHDVFEVPVFKTAQTPTQAEEDAIEHTFAVSVPKSARPDHLTVRVSQNAEGTEFYFPAARNKSFATSISVFAAIFSTVTYFLVHAARIVFIFPLAFGFFSLLLIYFSVQMWLATTRVVIGNSLKLQSGYLGGGRIQQIALTDIDTITDKITGQQGGATGTPYYDIQMTLRNGRKLTLGQSVADKRETEWLVSEMRRLTGVAEKSLGQKSMTAGTN